MHYYTRICTIERWLCNIEKYVCNIKIGRVNYFVEAIQKSLRINVRNTNDPVGFREQISTPRPTAKPVCPDATEAKPSDPPR